MNNYDSTGETLQHIAKVHINIGDMIRNLQQRARVHDASKLEEPEKSFFDKYRPMLNELEYESPEYKQARKELQPALQHHYEVNSHHPEHYAYWLFLFYEQPQTKRWLPCRN